MDNHEAAGGLGSQPLGCEKRIFNLMEGAVEGFWERHFWKAASIGLGAFALAGSMAPTPEIPSRGISAKVEAEPKGPSSRTRAKEPIEKLGVEQMQALALSKADQATAWIRSGRLGELDGALAELQEAENETLSSAAVRVRDEALAVQAQPSQPFEGPAGDERSAKQAFESDSLEASWRELRRSQELARIQESRQRLRMARGM